MSSCDVGLASHALVRLIVILSIARAGDEWLNLCLETP